MVTSYITTCSAPAAVTFRSAASASCDRQSSSTQRARVRQIVRNDGDFTPISASTRIVSALLVGSMIRASTRRLKLSVPTESNPTSR